MVDPNIKALYILVTAIIVRLILAEIGILDFGGKGIKEFLNNIRKKKTDDYSKQPFVHDWNAKKIASITKEGITHIFYAFDPMTGGFKNAGDIYDLIIEAHHLELKDKNNMVYFVDRSTKFVYVYNPTSKTAPITRTLDWVCSHNNGLEYIKE